MVDHLNKLDSRLIVTIEDPIEYLYEDQHCVITQREVGADTSSFATALKHALRQDVDVILVGEMRDLETIEACLTAAETGHLVLSTLHTSSSPMTIDRIGYGAGQRDLDEQPNVLRLLVGQSTHQNESGEQVCVLETNLDDHPFPEFDEFFRSNPPHL